MSNHIRSVIRNVAMINRFILALGLVACVAVTKVSAQEPESPPPESEELSGNPIEYETLGEGSIIIKATDEDLLILEALIARLDQETERPVIEFIQLDNAPAIDLAGQLQKIFQERVLR